MRRMQSLILSNHKKQNQNGRWEKSLIEYVKEEKKYKQKEDKEWEKHQKNLRQKQPSTKHKKFKEMNRKSWLKRYKNLSERETI